MSSDPDNTLGRASFEQAKLSRIRRARVALPSHAPAGASLRLPDPRNLAVAHIARRTPSPLPCGLKRTSPASTPQTDADTSTALPARSPHSASDNRSSSGRILIVADTATNPLLSALENAGHDFLVAENGWSALAVLHHTTPDLVLIGSLPTGMDAATLCRRIKSRQECRDVPVIFLSPDINVNPAVKQQAFDAGAIDYLTTPMAPREVLARIAAHLKIRFAQRALIDELTLRIEAETHLKHSLDRAVVITDAQRHIVFSTRLADTFLQRHFADFTGGVLPSGFLTDSSPLLVRRQVSEERSDLTMFVLEEKCEPPHPSALLPLGLTRREAEVLFWVAQGKGNADIAILLGASVRTVHKHVENIFRKLGCETRTAAAFSAAAVLSTSPL